MKLKNATEVQVEVTSSEQDDVAPSTDMGIIAKTKISAPTYVHEPSTTPGAALASSVPEVSPEDEQKITTDAHVAPATPSNMAVTSNKANAVVKQNKNSIPESTTTSSSSAALSLSPAGSTVPVNHKLTDLPDVPNSSLNRQFNIEGIDGVEITSFDITQHGCYAIAG